MAVAIYISRKRGAAKLSNVKLIIFIKKSIYKKTVRKAMVLSVKKLGFPSFIADQKEYCECKIF